MMLDAELMVDFETLDKPRKRLFETGQMKLLALHLIAQAPKHGYEIIKEIGDVVGGGYTPSAGTIYPTLNSLEDARFIKVSQPYSDKKQYSITTLGTEHLQQQQDVISKMLCRFDTRKQIQNNEQYLDIKRAMTNLKASLRLKIQHSELSPEQVREIADQIDLAAVHIARL